MTTTQPEENPKPKVEKRKKTQIIERKESSDGKKANKAKYRVREDGKLFVGRPTKKTPEIMEKFKEAFAIDCTDEEACAYVGIHRDTFNTRMNEDREFSDTIKVYKQQYLIDIRTASKKRALDTKNKDSTEILFKRDKRYSDKTEVDVGESSLIALAKMAEQDRLKREKGDK